MARANYQVEKRNLDILDYAPSKVNVKESSKVMRSGNADAVAMRPHDKKVRRKAPRESKRAELPKIADFLCISNSEYDLDDASTVINFTKVRQWQLLYVVYHSVIHDT